ncbi:hypothetical protein ABZ532_27325 [Streptomyces sp. NPDC019396]|uniref:hypothetical protein n=1 Tax=Streptomyces sp. NPDC019396 TaxID=3154687 RepID=UPI0033F24D5F
MTDTGASRTIAVSSPGEAAGLAWHLYDEAGGYAGQPPVPVVSYEPGAGVLARREALRDVYGAIVDRVGEPTLYGGSAQGPNVRWRDDSRLLLLSGDRFGARLSVHHTEILEAEEYRSFAWGDIWSPAGAGDFDLLPYSWQLYRNGPGERPVTRAGAWLAGCWEHLEKALELMLGAWAEQLPVQLPGDWAGFTILSGRDPGRELVVSYNPDEGLGVAVDDRDSGQGPERERQMRGRGWHARDRGWWQSVFHEVYENAARLAARLTVTELRARGAVTPDDLVVRDMGVSDRGELWLPGLGIRMS